MVFFQSPLLGICARGGGSAGAGGGYGYGYGYG